MLFEIIHRTRYRYSRPVSLEPLTLRLRPRCDAMQTLQNHRMEVSPQPGGISHCTDLDGNHTTTVWFNGPHQDLTIEAHSLLETHNPNPFNFIVTDPAALQLPLQYERHLALVLGPYLMREAQDAQVAAFAQELMHTAGHATLPFLGQLAAAIHARFEYMLREHGAPWPADETMRQGRGSCRDFAMLFIDVCRSAGIAARFVSGYCIGDEAADSHMHAWAEVYLPGAGWRGFDPSRGLGTGEDHIAVAAGQRPHDAAPTCGSFRGEATSSLDADISIRLLAG